MSYEEINAAKVVGTKEYSCEWCAEKIAKGEKHFYRVYRYCGDFNSGRMHLECETAMRDEDPQNLQDGWTPGDYKRGTIDGR